MANSSDFSIVTYERKPWHWGAAITRMARAGSFVQGDKVRRVVTPVTTRPSQKQSLQPKSSSKS